MTVMELRCAGGEDQWLHSSLWNAHRDVQSARPVDLHADDLECTDGYIITEAYISHYSLLNAIIRQCPSQTKSQANQHHVS